MTTVRAALVILLVLLPLLPVCAQEALVAGSQPVSVGMSLGGPGGPAGHTFTLHVQVATAATVSVFCPVAPGLMSFTGLTQKIEATYDQKRQLLSLNLPPGQYKLTIRAL